eukprot:4499312-Pleurochrysis_carterae.AAC.3
MPESCSRAALMKTGRLRLTRAGPPPHSAGIHKCRSDLIGSGDWPERAHKRIEERRSQAGRDRSSAECNATAQSSGFADRGETMARVIRSRAWMAEFDPCRTRGLRRGVGASPRQAWAGYRRVQVHGSLDA